VSLRSGWAYLIPQGTIMGFPFEVPDLTTATDETLAGLLGLIREYAATLTGDSTPTADTIDSLRACRDLAVDVTAEINGRTERAAEAAVLADELAAATVTPEPPTQPAVTPEPAPADPEPAAVTAAAGRTRPPAVRDVAARRSGTADVELPDRSTWATMAAAADVPGFSTGSALATFADAANALSARMSQYPAMGAGQAMQTGNKRPVTAYSSDGRLLEMRSYSRHGAVQFRRHFPSELVADDTNGLRVAEYAASERRLPGGSLVNSMRAEFASGRALTAAAGWCAPSETIYDLAELETLDGILSLPELQTSRGGWNIPTAGGPAFSVIWNGIGNSGTTHITEAGVISDTTKYCYDIPCPGFTDVRLGVDYVCLTGGLLQRRGYPEVVARFSRGALTALAHKINQGVIAAMVTAAGAATVIPADPSGDDAISSLLAAVDLAIIDAKASARMSFNGTMEVVLPMWVLAQIRAAGSRRNGVDMVSMTEAQIVEWFSERRAVPRFVYDWQDSFSGLATGPGGAVPLTALPLTCQFLVYPAGTFVKAVQDVVSLDTVYDSTKLATNEYTAVFAEDGWAILQMGPIARRYTVPVDPSGVVACCPS
jgi:hypothetical protein